MTAERTTALASKELRRRRRQGQAGAPPRPALLRVPKPIRRLQRRAPMYAIQGLSALSARLREMTGHEVIDMNRVMEVIQFAYRQRELARRGPNDLVDDFGFDAEWTESFLSVFKVLYRDYWRVETTGIENVPATG